MRARGVEPSLPPNRAPHITDALMKIGPVDIAGMDRAPLSWSEINAWCAEVGPALPSWQRELIRRLSAAFLTESRAAEEPDAPEPIGIVHIDRDVVGRSIRAALAGWKKYKA